MQKQPIVAPIVTVFGGAGFLGRYVVRALAREGFRIKVISRHPERGQFLKTAGSPGQITLMKADVTQGDSIPLALKDADAAINLVGILYPTRSGDFTQVHAQGAERIAQSALKSGLKTFIHVSALGVDRATNSLYARTKLNGEKAVGKAFPGCTIIRPSVIFGPDDNFFNQFAKMSALSPFMPLIGGGKTKFQPVYAGDIAEAIVSILMSPHLQGKTYELAGNEAVSFKEILDYIMELTGHNRPFLPLPFPVAKLMASFLQLLPTPPLTRDQVRLLETDNVPSGNYPGFENISITPRRIEDVVPSYLAPHAS